MQNRNIIDQARIISRELSHYNRVDKALNDIQAIIRGKSSLTLEYLQVTEQQLQKANNSADHDKEDSYMKLTHLVNEGTRA